jgi:hypothetical protein
MPGMDGDIVTGDRWMAEIRADREHTTGRVYCRVNGNLMPWNLPRQTRH